MQNNSLTTLSLDNLITVIGGYYDRSGSASPTSRDDAPDDPHQGTPGARLGQLVKALAARGIKFPVPGR